MTTQPLGLTAYYRLDWLQITETDQARTGVQPSHQRLAAWLERGEGGRYRTAGIAVSAYTLCLLQHLISCAHAPLASARPLAHCLLPGLRCQPPAEMPPDTA
jgi:hypothetical protein